MPRDPAIEAAMFFTRAGKICREAEFIVQSFPNTDMHAVKRSSRLLAAVWDVLQRTDFSDHTPNPASVPAMLGCVEALVAKLHAFEIAPPPPRNAGVKRVRTGRPGQPAYYIDIDNVLFHRGIGAKYKDIAKAVGVSVRTLRNHLQAAGILTTTRRLLSIISDEQLDRVMSGLVAVHPFSGVTIMKGFLDSMNIVVPKKRVNESLRRVDPIGILIRYVQTLRFCAPANFDFKNYLVGQLLFIGACTKSAERKLSGTKMATKSYATGASGCMDALTAIAASLSTWNVDLTRPRGPSSRYFAKVSAACVARQAVYEVIMDQKIMALKP